ncbi:MAG: hypothetical protein KDC80_08635 [Saprospiraceae bacterium]|nr:hypothetical protein [Saprospiraceae bacterium]
MKTIIISYTLTGNNAALAKAVARNLDVPMLTIREEKRRRMWNIVWDMMTNRNPKITEFSDDLEKYDLVIFSGPVWMGHIATPFRSIFKKFHGRLKRYIYLSISGGADGDNLDLEKELIARLGTAPEAVIDLHIADLLPDDPKPERKDTMHYQLKDSDLKYLTGQVLEHPVFSTLPVEQGISS